MSTVAGLGLARRFGGVHAVAGVDVEVQRGEIVAVVGPNGSGKSTLIDVLTGVVSADHGTVSVDSRVLRHVSAAAVARRGVRRTFQNGRLIESLSAFDNVRLGLHVSPGRRGFVPGGTTRRRSMSAIEHMAISHLATRRVAHLSAGERRRVELARALVGNPGAVVLDEPTAGLPRADGRRLIELLRGVAGGGAGVLMIEHDLEMVRLCADRVVVMVDGRVCAEGGTATLDDAAVRLALGQPAEHAAPHDAAGIGPALLSAHELTVRRGGRTVLHEASVDLRGGEVIALLGGNGSGKTTLLAALSGLLPLRHGSVAVGDREISRWPVDRIARHGVAHLPQRRHLFGSLSTADNLAVSDAAAGARTPLGLDEILDRLPELAARLHVPVNRLSGGEQQLVMLARGLRTRPTIILADEPTAALAPSARHRVLGWLRELADAGAAVLLAEQNAVEAVAVANRTITMREGLIEPLHSPEVTA